MAEQIQMLEGLSAVAVEEEPNSIIPGRQSNYLGPYHSLGGLGAFPSMSGITTWISNNKMLVGGGLVAVGAFYLWKSGKLPFLGHSPRSAARAMEYPLAGLAGRYGGGRRRRRGGSSRRRGRRSGGLGGLPGRNAKGRFTKRRRSRR